MRVPFRITAVALCLGLATACAGEPEVAEEAVVADVAVPAPATEPAMGGDLVALTEQANEALAGELTAVPIATAGALIENIANQLRATGNETFVGIASNLDQLRTQLTAPTFDASAVSATLRTLSEQVGAAAPAAGAAQPALQTLSERLGNAARALGGGM